MSRTSRNWVVGGLVFAGLLLVMFVSQMAPPGLHMGALSGMLAVLFMALFWGAIIGGGVWFALTLSRSSVGTPLTPHDKSVSLLRERYARGEINRAEYFQMLQDLETD